MATESILITADEVAVLAAVKRSTVYGLARRGESPGVVYVGRLLRFRRGAIMKWLEGESRASKRERRR